MKVSNSKTFFVCQSCGYRVSKWMGRCPDCAEWNSLVEETAISSFGGKGMEMALAGENKPQPINAIEMIEEKRLKTGIAEFDRVLGGGLVPGSLVLIGGDPGIGKSTLLLQVFCRFSMQGHKVLYISGEESVKQIRLRSDRLNAVSDNLWVVSETSMEAIQKMVETTAPDVLAVDSIQTVFNTELSSAPGSVSQVREATMHLMYLAKRSDIPIFLVGHVTKEGAIAGPRVLEHMVDTVLYFEGERSHVFRILRAVKNRFGSTNEIGVFEMKDSGLSEVANPSAVFLAERPVDAAGSVVVASIEGSRPILVELQALVSTTTYGNPRRTAIGVDSNRVSLLVAVLEKKLGFNLMDQDIFLNVAGGVKVDEPAIDLGIAVATASSFLDKPLPDHTIVLGEVGLTGEVRGINQIETRIAEANKMGFQRCILPKNNLSRLKAPPEMTLIGVKTLEETMEKLF
ncbi:MAG: DNA repair protein RadA [Deltaproteobacteria bacterium]|nr:DNA repair protein RadA [Deltaproteobacteria bacterium]